MENIEELKNRISNLEEYCTGLQKAVFILFKLTNATFDWQGHEPDFVEWDKIKNEDREKMNEYIKNMYSHLED